MARLNEIYGTSLGLLTDLYQLTMAYGYWKLGRAEKRAAFNLFFRRNPFGGAFTVAAGLESAIEYLRGFRFEASDIEYLCGLTGNDGKPLFEQGFLDYLSELKFTCDVDAVPEGTVMFPHEPLLRVGGPILQAQLIETPLLNMINFQTLIATKAARVSGATQGEPVLEFGLRRAQGIDGALAASRAAYVGGCAATSNVLAGKLFGIPVKGTHAHSWVMSFDDELEAFDAYANVLPNNCVFLVDTFDTIEGVRKSVEVGKRLRAKGYEMVGIRLDSGDLAALSIEARRILDDGGFTNAAIVASNDLDEHAITELKENGATIAVWGVGTKLVTAHDQPALGGVYKLSAIEDDDGILNHKLKLSEQPIKVSTPGVLQVRRYHRNGTFVADMVHDETLGVGDEPAIVDFTDARNRTAIADAAGHEDLLTPVFRDTECVYESPSLGDIRKRAQSQIGMLDSGVKRLTNGTVYPTGLEENLHALKMELINKARNPLPLGEGGEERVG